MSFAQTLCNIFNTPLPSDADVVKSESNDADTSEEEEEYYVCLECERLGNESHNHHDDEPNMDGNQNVAEDEKEDILSEPKPEPVSSDNESESNGASSDFVGKYVTVQTEQNASVGSQESSVSIMPDISSSVSLNHALESTSSQNCEKETTDLPENSFAPSVFEDLDESHNTGTIGSSVSSGSRLSTPLPQTPQIKIEGRQLLSIFQRSPENVIEDLSALLRTAGVEITGVNELKDVKIKIETPRSVKKEANSRKRRRSPKFYTPPKRRAVRKGSIGSVKTKSGETKIFTEWDDDEFIESD